PEFQVRRLDLVLGRAFAADVAPILGPLDERDAVHLLPVVNRATVLLSSEFVFEEYPEVIPRKQEPARERFPCLWDGPLPEHLNVPLPVPGHVRDLFHRALWG